MELTLVEHEIKELRTVLSQLPILSNTMSSLLQRLSEQSQSDDSMHGDVPVTMLPHVAAARTRQPSMSIGP